MRFIVTLRWFHSTLRHRLLWLSASFLISCDLIDAANYVSSRLVSSSRRYQRHLNRHNDEIVSDVHPLELTQDERWSFPDEQNICDVPCLVRKDRRRQWLAVNATWGKVIYGPGKIYVHGSPKVWGAVDEVHFDRAPRPILTPGGRNDMQVIFQDSKISFSVTVAICIERLTDRSFFRGLLSSLSSLFLKITRIDHSCREIM